MRLKSVELKKNNMLDTFDLNSSTYLLYAAKNYDNSNCADIAEFYSDLNRIVHIKKLTTRYMTDDNICERLYLNHYISFFNVFNPFAASKILFFKTGPAYYSAVKTTLTYLNRCPPTVRINGGNLHTNSIAIDETLMKRLEAI